MCCKSGRGLNNHFPFLCGVKPTRETNLLNFRVMEKTYEKIGFYKGCEIFRIGDYYYSTGRVYGKTKILKNLIAVIER